MTTIYASPPILNNTSKLSLKSSIDKYNCFQKMEQPPTLPRHQFNYTVGAVSGFTINADLTEEIDQLDAKLDHMNLTPIHQTRNNKVQLRSVQSNTTPESDVTAELNKKEVESPPRFHDTTELPKTSISALVIHNPQNLNSSKQVKVITKPLNNNLPPLMTKTPVRQIEEESDQHITLTTRSQLITRGMSNELDEP